MNRYFLSSEIGVSWFKWATSKRQVDRSVFLCHFLSVHSFYSFPILIQGSWNPFSSSLGYYKTTDGLQFDLADWCTYESNYRLKPKLNSLVVFFILLDEKHLTWTWGRLMKCQLCTDDSLQWGGIIPGGRNPRPGRSILGSSLWTPQIAYCNHLYIFFPNTDFCVSGDITISS